MISTANHDALLSCFASSFIDPCSEGLRLAPCWVIARLLYCTALNHPVMFLYYNPMPANTSPYFTDTQCQNHLSRLCRSRSPRCVCPSSCVQKCAMTWPCITRSSVPDRRSSSFMSLSGMTLCYPVTHRCRCHFIASNFVCTCIIICIAVYFNSKLLVVNRYYYHLTQFSNEIRTATPWFIALSTCDTNPPPLLLIELALQCSLFFFKVLLTSA